MITVERIEELRKLEAQIKELKEQAEAIKDEFKAEMGNEELLEIDGFKIHYPIVISERLDSKRLKADKPELFKEYKSENITRKFSITFPVSKKA